MTREPGTPEQHLLEQDSNGTCCQVAQRGRSHRCRESMSEQLLDNATRARIERASWQPAGSEGVLLLTSRAPGSSGLLPAACVCVWLPPSLWTAVQPSHQPGISVRTAPDTDPGQTGHLAAARWVLKRHDRRQLTSPRLDFGPTVARRAPPRSSGCAGPAQGTTGRPCVNTLGTRLVWVM